MKKKHSINKAKKYTDVEALTQRVTSECPPRGVYYYKVPKDEEAKSKVPIKFEDLPISHTSISGLRNANYTIMTDIQRCTIPHALNGRDILACSRTGSGKTLAYIVPIIENLYREKWTEFDGLGALIIVPTRELAIQIYMVFQQVCKGQQLTVTYAVGGTSVDKEKFLMSHMNIVICTPGRLLQHITETFNFNVDNMKMLVVDEMDRILDSGFEPTIRQILKHIPKGVHKMLFSATLSKSIKSLVSMNMITPEYISLHGYKENEIMHSIDDDNEIVEQNAKPKSVTPLRLQQFYMIVKVQDKINTLYAFIKAHKHQKCIVFVSSCKQVRYIYETFKRLELAVPFSELHGRQKQGKRTAIFMDFIERKKSYLIATDLASRGIDFPYVDWVIQLDCPEDIDSYIHRVGRTARYRAKGSSLLFLDPSEGAFINQLKSKNLVPKQLHTKKTEDISPQLLGLLSEKPELKYLAERAVVSYLKSIHLAANKEVFNSKNYDLQQFSYSLGLESQVKIKIDEDSSEEEEKVVTKSKLQKLREKIKQKKEEKKRELMGEIKTQEGKVVEEKKIEIEHVKEEEQEDFLVKKEKQTEISDEPIPVKISKRKLKRIKPEGVMEGKNITTFDEEGNPVQKQDLIQKMREALTANAQEKGEEEKFHEKIKSKLKDEKEEDKAQYEQLLKERKKKRKMRIKGKTPKPQEENVDKEESNGDDKE